MLERSLLALVIVGFGVLGYVVLRRLQLRKLQRGGSGSVPGLETFVGGVPAILYFTTPDCVPCRTIRGPAVSELRDEYPGEVQIIEIDASARSDVAAHWGVLSVPTTFVLDRSGTPHDVNHGVTRAKKLRRQVNAAATG
jgi:thioredoxin 1